MVTTLTGSLALDPMSRSLVGYHEGSSGTKHSECSELHFWSHLIAVSQASRDPVDVDVFVEL